MMSDETPFDPRELAEERAVNERHLREARALVQRMAKIAGGLPRARNEIWSGSPIKPVVTRDIVAPLIGRVALDGDDDNLGDGFYVGWWHQEWDGIQVVSWVAPVARLFYDGPRAAYPLAEDVTARRTFSPRGLDIVDLVDDIDRPSVERPFAKRARRRLDVPAAPTPAPRPVRPATPTQPVRHPVGDTTHDGGQEIPTERVPPVRRVGAAGQQAPAGPAADAAASATPTPPTGEARPAPLSPEHPPTRPTADAPLLLRAERAVRQAIERPRTGRLGAVLATLQPDQFRLVTWPAERPLVVQGHPGTGKTIIATHRAAFLTHPERGAERLHRVGFVGPTEPYVEHVTGALAELDVEGVHLLALPRLLIRLAGLPTEPARHGPDRRLDTDWALARIAQRAAGALKDAMGTRRGHQDRVRHVVSALASDATLRGQVVQGSDELGRWIADLDWGKARADARFLPYLAAVGLAVQPPLNAELFDHLIVDEAQDIRPLEWQILTSFLRPGGSLSLFGDTNQRRSDWTAPSWLDLATDLELTDDDGRFQEELIEVGYRSTQEILRFSNGLLPRDAREVRSLRTGIDPTVHKAPIPDLAATVVHLAVDMCARHADGLVAVLSMDPRAVSDAFRRLQWKRGQLQHSWESDGQRVVILHPTNARGLEFDGVVVVEPSDYPENVGRLGLLYTSLTRATKELAVAHSRPLPSGLRVRRR